MSIYVRQVGLIFANKLHIRGSVISYRGYFNDTGGGVNLVVFDRTRIEHSASQDVLWTTINVVSLRTEIVICLDIIA